MKKHLLVPLCIINIITYHNIHTAQTHDYKGKSYSELCKLYTSQIKCNTFTLAQYEKLVHIIDSIGIDAGSTRAPNAKELKKWSDRRKYHSDRIALLTELSHVSSGEFKKLVSIYEKLQYTYRESHTGYGHFKRLKEHAEKNFLMQCARVTIENSDDLENLNFLKGLSTNKYLSKEEQSWIQHNQDIIKRRIQILREIQAVKQQKKESATKELLPYIQTKKSLYQDLITTYPEIPGKDTEQVKTFLDHKIKKLRALESFLTYRNALSPDVQLAHLALIAQRSPHNTHLKKDVQKYAAVHLLQAVDQQHQQTDFTSHVAIEQLHDHIKRTRDALVLQEGPLKTLTLLEEKAHDQERAVQSWITSFWNANLWNSTKPQALLAVFRSIQKNDVTKQSLQPYLTWIRQAQALYAEATKQQDILAHIQAPLNASGHEEYKRYTQNMSTFLDLYGEKIPQPTKDAIIQDIRRINAIQQADLARHASIGLAAAIYQSKEPASIAPRAIDEHASKPIRVEAQKITHKKDIVRHEGETTVRMDSSFASFIMITEE